jgi:hypothetical protein
MSSRAELEELNICNRQASPTWRRALAGRGDCPDTAAAGIPRVRDFYQCVEQILEQTRLTVVRKCWFN